MSLIKEPGKIQIVTGPMFAAKSSYLLAQIRRDRVIGIKILIIGWSKDTRSNSHLKTHDHESEPAIMVYALKDVLLLKEYEECSKIIIDEGHFFGDLCNSVLLMAHRDGKDVLIGGLYADYKAEPFDEMVKLMAHAKVKFLTALCKKCKDGTEAIYTKFIDLELVEDSRFNVGGSEKYMSVCAKHFLDL